MRTVLICCVLAVACEMSVRASEPGQPLNCSDWVILQPGFSCSPDVRFGVLTVDSVFSRRGGDLGIDNSEVMYATRLTVLASRGNGDSDLDRLELLTWANGNEEVVAYIEDRQGATVGLEDHIRPQAAFTWSWPVSNDIVRSNIVPLDPTSGNLLVPLRSFCQSSDPSHNCPSAEVYGGGWWIAGIGEYSTQCEILEGYTLATVDVLRTVPSGRSERPPALPRGLRRAGRQVAGSPVRVAVAARAEETDPNAASDRGHGPDEPCVATPPRPGGGAAIRVQLQTWSPWSSPLTEQYPAAFHVRSLLEEAPGLPATPPLVVQTAMNQTLGFDSVIVPVPAPPLAKAQPAGAHW
jgi:hypothetical protein